MTTIKTVQDFLAWSKPIRDVFGFMTGMRIALQVRSAMWAAPAGTQVQIRIPGWKSPVTLRAGSSDSAVFLQVMVDRQGYFPVHGSPVFIVDAGANIGLVSLCLANRFPQALIVALEIDGENAVRLRDNCKDYPQIVPETLGLWSHTTTLTVANPRAHSWAFRATEANAASGGTIAATGIRDLLARYQKDRIDVLKIDIEGGEYEVFASGLDEWIDQVNMLAIEIHERIRPGVTELICSQLAQRNFNHQRWAEYWLFYRPDNELAPSQV